MTHTVIFSRWIATRPYWEGNPLISVTRFTVPKVCAWGIEGDRERDCVLSKQWSRIPLSTRMCDITHSRRPLIKRSQQTSVTYSTILTSIRCQRALRADTWVTTGVYLLTICVESFHFSCASLFEILTHQVSYLMSVHMLKLNQVSIFRKITLVVLAILRGEGERERERQRERKWRCRCVDILWLTVSTPEGEVGKRRQHCEEGSRSTLTLLTGLNRLSDRIWCISASAISRLDGE